MRTLVRDVGRFHVATDTPIQSTPAIPSEDRKRLRIDLVTEEVVKELLPAMEADDIEKIADAMIDSIYVIVGAALEYGIPLDLIWPIVQSANMAKVTSTVAKRADGKVLKPEGWVPPDAAIAQVIEWARQRGSWSPSTSALSDSLANRPRLG